MVSFATSISETTSSPKSHRFGDWFFISQDNEKVDADPSFDTNASRTAVKKAIESYYSVSVLDLEDDIAFDDTNKNYRDISGSVIIKAKNSSSAQKCSLETLSASKSSNNVILICGGTEPPKK